MILQLGYPSWNITLLKSDNYIVYMYIFNVEITDKLVFAEKIFASQ